MKKVILTILVIVFIGINSLLTFSQSGGSFTIEKSVIAGGGERSSGGSFTLDGSIGEAVAGTTSIQQFGITGDRPIPNAFVP